MVKRERESPREQTGLPTPSSGLPSFTTERKHMSDSVTHPCVAFCLDSVSANFSQCDKMADSNLLRVEGLVSELPVHGWLAHLVMIRRKTRGKRQGQLPFYHRPLLCSLVSPHLPLLLLPPQSQFKF